MGSRCTGFKACDFGFEKLLATALVAPSQGSALLSLVPMTYLLEEAFLAYLLQANERLATRQIIACAAPYLTTNRGTNQIIDADVEELGAQGLRRVLQLD